MTTELRPQLCPCHPTSSFLQHSCGFGEVVGEGAASSNSRQSPVGKDCLPWPGCQLLSLESAPSQVQLQMCHCSFGRPCSVPDPAGPRGNRKSSQFKKESRNFHFYFVIPSVRSAEAGVGGRREDTLHG